MTNVLLILIKWQLGEHTRKLLIYYLLCIVVFSPWCLSCSKWQICVLDRWMIICAVALNTGPADPINLKPNLLLWPTTETWPLPEKPHSGIILYLFIYAHIIPVALKWPWLQRYRTTVYLHWLVQHEVEQTRLWSLLKAFCQHILLFLTV